MRRSKPKEHFFLLDFDDAFPGSLGKASLRTRDSVAAGPPLVIPAGIRGGGLVASSPKFESRELALEIPPQHDAGEDALRQIACLRARPNISVGGGAARGTGDIITPLELFLVHLNLLLPHRGL